MLAITLAYTESIRKYKPKPYLDGGRFNLRLRFYRDHEAQSGLINAANVINESSLFPVTNENN